MLSVMTLALPERDWSPARILYFTFAIKSGSKRAYIAKRVALFCFALFQGTQYMVSAI